VSAELGWIGGIRPAHMLGLGLFVQPRRFFVQDGARGPYLCKAPLVGEGLSTKAIDRRSAGEGYTA
jgi:hypothetical protein